MFMYLRSPFLTGIHSNARLNSHYEAWTYKKKKQEKIKAYRKSVQKELALKRCLLILDLKSLKSQVKGKDYILLYQALIFKGTAKTLITYLENINSKIKIVCFTKFRKNLNSHFPVSKICFAICGMRSKNLFPADNFGPIFAQNYSSLYLRIHSKGFSQTQEHDRAQLQI